MGRVTATTGLIAVAGTGPIVNIAHAIIGPITIAPPLDTAQAIRMCAGATTVIAHTGLMTTRFSPIMGHGVNAIRPICKAKSPGFFRGFLQNHASIR